MIYYDPPEGWKYGFPKEYKPLDGESITDTLRRDGYPEKLMELAEWCRFWGDEPQGSGNPAAPESI